MLCDPLELPDEVIAAQEQGRLVIFAGAGVSMGPPSNLPGFGDLAAEIVKNTQHSVRKPHDEFLGDMVANGVQVHQLCRDIIAAPSSVHSPIHTDLLRLFRAKEHVRVVTTNFDPHFLGAAGALGWAVPVYNAPALPLGHDFTGVVHLHGSVHDEPRRLVLTDADFGQAYLTDAWASTFLRSLFTEFTVLFIGYSHEDPPIKYLARGLAGRRGQKRYALTAEADLAKWRALGITPVGYPLQAEPDKHGLLLKGVRRWVEITELQPLEIEARVRAILTSPEKVEPNRSETDFLRRCLLRDETAQYFERYAQGMRWIEWLHQEKLLAPYVALDYAKKEPSTDEEKSRETAARRIANWVGRQLAHENAGRGLWFVDRCGGRLGNIAASSLGYEFIHNKEIDLAHHGIAAWIELLAQSIPTPRWAEMLGQLLVRLGKMRLWPAALRLFAACCRASGKLEAWPVLSETPEKENASLRIRVAQGSTYLPRAWQECFQPALPELAEELLNLLEEVVRDAHRLARSLGQGDDHTNRLLLTRSHIQMHSAYGGETDLGCVVTWFTKVVTFLTQQTPGLPLIRIESWLKSGDPVLHRVALHAMTETARMPALEKWNWIKRHELLFKPVAGARHEVYALVKKIYPELGDTAQAELWASVEAGPPDDSINHVAEEAERARFRQSMTDRLVWALHQAFPQDKRAKAAFAHLEQRNPGFAKAKHEHIDLDFWMGGVRNASVSPRTPEDLLKQEPADLLDYLLTFKSGEWLEPNREGLAAAAAAAAGQNTIWGMKLMRLLATGGHWDSDLWPALVWKLSFATLPVEGQKWIIANLVGPLSQRVGVLNGLTHFLFNGSLFSKESPPDPSVLEALAKVSVELWQAVRQHPTDEDNAKLEQEDWLGLAINRPPGRIVEFWLRCTDHWRKSDAPPTSWPPVFAAGFDQIAEAATLADWQGLGILGCHLSFARAVAPEWTRTKLYPWLDFKVAGERAWPLFHALVSYGSLNRDLLLEIPPYFLAAVPWFTKAEEKATHAFLAMVGLIIYPGLWEVTASGWLKNILLGITPEQRVSFADSLGQALRDVSPADMAAFWKRWMHEYWKERLNGRPLLLTAEENGVMVSWVWHLPPAEFAQAAELLQQGPKPVLDHWLPLEMMLETGLPARAPSALLDLWGWTLEMCPHYYGDKEEYERFLGSLPKDPALLSKWERICQALGRYGAQYAQALLTAGKAHFVAV
jgi:hypothetical protein